MNQGQAAGALADPKRERSMLEGQCSDLEKNVIGFREALHRLTAAADRLGHQPPRSVGVEDSPANVTRAVSESFEQRLRYIHQDLKQLDLDLHNLAGRLDLLI